MKKIGQSKFLKIFFSSKNAGLGFALGAFLVLGFFVYTLYSSAAWTNPTTNPTGGNVTEPIYVGTSAAPITQTKYGTLKLGTTTPSVVSNLFVYNGKVGINTTTANTYLTIEPPSFEANDIDIGSGRIVGLALIPFNNNEAASKYYTDQAAEGASFWTATSSSIYNKNTGNVGIGTTNPLAGALGKGLHIYQTGANNALLRVEATGSGSSFVPSVQMKRTNNAADQKIWDYIVYPDGHWAFRALNDAENTATDFLQAWRTGITIDKVLFPNGFVGIGTTAPSETLTPAIKLEVAGSIKASGQFIVGNGDLAEEFYTDRDYPAGTVLVMDDKGYKSARASGKEYDTGVIGVISENPGVVIGKMEGEHKALVALVGVIKVLINNSGGDIRQGDLLTTSAITGEAMKAAVPQLGTIIGKALENDTGKGFIMVLVNLK